MRFYGKLHHRLLKITHWATNHHLKCQYSRRGRADVLMADAYILGQMLGKEGRAFETLKGNDMMISNERPDFNREIDEKGT